MTDQDWATMVRLAETRNGEHRDSRQILASLVLKHETDINELKDVVAKLIVEGSQKTIEVGL